MTDLQERADERLSKPLVVLGIAIFAVLGLLAGAYEVMLIPLRAGSVLLPVTIALAVLTNAALPVLSRRISDSSPAAAAPFIGWMLGVVVLATGRPEGDVFLPGGSGGDALVGYGLMLAGFVTGVVTVLRTGANALARQREQRRPVRR